MTVLGHWRDSLLKPDDAPRWEIDGRTMRADGPWLKNTGRIAVVPEQRLQEVAAALLEIADFPISLAPGQATNDLRYVQTLAFDVLRAARGQYEPRPVDVDVHSRPNRGARQEQGT